MWWWIGVPLVIAGLTWFPYVVLNTLAHVEWSAWRVHFIPIVLFDASAYFQWIGAALSGYPAGDNIRSFAGLIHALGFILPASWSVAEVWLFTLWLTVVIGVWTMVYTMRLWAGLSETCARLLSCFVCISLFVPFMGRPGVFTWYVPVYLFGLIGVWYTGVNLEQKKYSLAAAWTLGALIAAWVYPHFLVHLVLWLAVVWLMHWYGRSPRVTGVFSMLGILVVPVGVVLAMPIFLQPSLRLAFELHVRLGLMFTRWPIISNSLILVLLWGVLLGSLIFYVREGSSMRGRLQLLVIGWLTLAAAWLSNIFTGVYIQNDHFRAPAVLLSWLSLAVVYGLVERSAFARELLVTRQSSKTLIGLLSGLCVISVSMLVWYVVVKRFVFTGDYLNIVHASQWLGLAVASVLVWFYVCKLGSVRAVWIALAVLSIVLGLSARLQVFYRERILFSQYIPYVPVITWIRAHVPASQDVCTDFRSGEILGSFTARMVHPSYAATMLPKSDEEIMEQLHTQLGYYDARLAKTEALFLSLLTPRGGGCTQFFLWSRISRRLGLSEADFIATTGCPVERLRRDEERLIQYMASRVQDEKRFKALCPTVVVKRTERSFWTWPRDYQETKINDEFSVLR